MTGVPGGVDTDLPASHSIAIMDVDIACCGSILELTKIAAMTETYMVALTPHCCNSTSVGLTSTLQKSSVMTNLPIAEYFFNSAERSNAITKSFGTRVEHGIARLDGSSGHDVELDDETLRRTGELPVGRVIWFVGLSPAGARRRPGETGK